MKPGLSLRLRLVILILVPLCIVAALVGTWAYLDAEQNAADRFDRSLLSTALAVSRDTVATGGNALSEETRDLLRDTSGGAVFYHVYAPNGAFVTGYATPPVPQQPGIARDSAVYYDAVYLGEDVRAFRFTQHAAIEGFSGPFTFTVWQANSVLDGFVRSRTGPVFAIITSLISAVVLIVWFGVRRGLGPLLSLEQAIGQRTIDDLSPIRRPIPPEVRGIVGRLNTLLTELSASIKAKDVLISDAAHQLKNPVAGVIALADAVVNASDYDTAMTRAGELKEAAMELGSLANSLLTLERIKAGVVKPQSFDAIPILRDIAFRATQKAQSRSVKFWSEIPDTTLRLFGDPVMFEQAVHNVIENALVHGGPKLTCVRLAAGRKGAHLSISVSDDGKGIYPEDYERALGRFSQVVPSPGSGLGLPISAAVCETFGGEMRLAQNNGLFTIHLQFGIDTAEFQIESRY